MVASRNGTGQPAQRRLVHHEPLWTQSSHTVGYPRTGPHQISQLDCPYSIPYMYASTPFYQLPDEEEQLDAYFLRSCSSCEQDRSCRSEQHDQAGCPVRIQQLVTKSAFHSLSPSTSSVGTCNSKRAFTPCSKRCTSPNGLKSPSSNAWLSGGLKYC